MQVSIEDLCKQLRSNSQQDIVRALTLLERSVTQSKTNEYLEHFPNAINFTMKHIRSGPIMEAWLDVIIALARRLKERVIEFFPKSCGGCFLSTILLIVHRISALELKALVLINSMLMDPKGLIVSSEALNRWIREVHENYPKYPSHQAGIGICLELKDSEAKEFIEGFGELLQDQDFYGILVTNSINARKKAELIVKKCKLSAQGAEAFFDFAISETD